MTIHQFAFLADENIDSGVIQFLKSQSIVIHSLWELDLIGASDTSVLQFSQKDKLVILTQDRDFGSLIHTLNLDFYAIIYLRPGHFSASHHIETLKSILKLEISLTPPFIIVAQNSSGKIKIRIREKLNE